MTNGLYRTILPKAIPTVDISDVLLAGIEARMIVLTGRCHRLLREIGFASRQLKDNH